MPNSTYISPSRLAVCSGCGGNVMRTRTSADEIYCLPCRREGKAPSKARHGTDRRYSNGCRCDVCRVHKRDAQRLYVEKRKCEGRPVRFSTHRRRVSSICEYCAASYEARVDSTRGKFCSVTCANDAQGRNANPKFRIAISARLALYERDGWVCQICNLPVARDANYLATDAPTLDHIQPRARGGSDDPENLRLACRDCNTKRGTDLDWVPALAG